MSLNVYTLKSTFGERTRKIISAPIIKILAVVLLVVVVLVVSLLIIGPRYQSKLSGISKKTVVEVKKEVAQTK